MGRKISYSSDMFFKYLFYDVNDEDCMYLLKLVIDGVLNISSSNFVVKNPNIIPDQDEDKGMYLDLRVENERGEQIDIEMQKSRFSTRMRYRFQRYGAKMLVTQLKKGEDYKNMRPVY